VQSSRRLIDDKIELQEGNLFMVHLAALFKKRAANFRRDKKAWLCTTVLPSLFVLIGFVVYKNSGRARNLPSLRLDLSALNSGVSGDFVNPIHFNKGEYECLPGRCVHDVVVESYSFCGGITRDRGVNDSGVKCSVSDSSLIMDTLDNYGGGEVIASESSSVSEVCIVCSCTAFPLTCLQSSEELLATSSFYGASQYGAIWFSREPGSRSSKNSSVFDVDVVAACLNASAYVSERDCERLRGVGFLIQYNFTGLHTAPLFQALADQALIRYATNKPDFVIKTSISPLPTTDIEDSFGRGEDSVMIWFLVSFPIPRSAASHHSPYRSFLAFPLLLEHMLRLLYKSANPRPSIFKQSQALIQAPIGFRHSYGTP
jgi:hypothetical protein